MNGDNELLFGVNDLERWKRRELSDGWLQQQTDILIARCHAQSEELEKLLASADPETVSRLNKPL